MKRLTILLCLAALAVAGRAHAQQPTTLTFPTGARWDAAGQLALLNRNTANLSRWNHWYSAPAVDGAAGRYWTPHVKTEFEIGTAGAGTIDGEDETPVPGLSVSFPRYREHTLRESAFGATAVYQFFDNQWVHPFVGAGAELVRERHTADALPAQTLWLSTTVPTRFCRRCPLSIASATRSVRS
jgi:opacity protein-like surface antigen